jgi:hypothetical protein
MWVCLACSWDGPKPTALHALRCPQCRAPLRTGTDVDLTCTADCGWWWLG